MSEYTVTWGIDVEADSPQEAAEAAMEIMVEPSFDIAIFRVSGPDTVTRRLDMQSDYELIEVPYPDEYGRAKCSLSFCDDTMYATHEDDGVRIDLCQYHYDEIAR